MNKKYFGNSVLIAWLVFSIWAGMEIVLTYGEIMNNVGFNLPAFMMLWLLVIFLGRFVIEWVITKLWRNNDKAF